MCPDLFIFMCCGTNTHLHTCHVSSTPTCTWHRAVKEQQSCSRTCSRCVFVVCDSCAAHSSCNAASGYRTIAVRLSYVSAVDFMHHILCVCASRCVSAGVSEWNDEVMKFLLIILLCAKNKNNPMLCFLLAGVTLRVKIKNKRVCNNKI